MSEPSPFSIFMAFSPCTPRAFSSPRKKAPCSLLRASFLAAFLSSMRRCRACLPSRHWISQYHVQHSKCSVRSRPQLLMLRGVLPDTLVFLFHVVIVVDDPNVLIVIEIMFDFGKGQPNILHLEKGVHGLLVHCGHGVGE